MTLNVARYHEIDLDASEFADLKAVFRYWHDVCADSGTIAPAWRSIDLVDVPPSILPRICVVNIIPEPLDFTYRYWGTAITNMHHYDLTRKSVLDLTPDHYARCIWDQYASVYNAGAPKCFITEVPLDDGRYTYYAAVRLPLSSDGKTIDMVMSAEEYGRERTQLSKHFDSPRR